MINHDRDALRQQIATAWARHKAGTPLNPLEAQIADVLDEHPEYHALIEDPDMVTQEFRPENGQINPFLHLSLHFAVRDQIRTNLPPGVRDLYQKLTVACGSAHDAEHVLLERLGEALYKSSRDGQPPDTEAYLRVLGEDLARMTR